MVAADSIWLLFDPWYPPEVQVSFAFTLKELGYYALPCEMKEHDGRLDLTRTGIFHFAETFDPELRLVLELATDAELIELENILFGPRLGYFLLSLLSSIMWSSWERKEEFLICCLLLVAVDFDHKTKILSSNFVNVHYYVGFTFLVLALNWQIMLNLFLTKSLV